MAEMQWINAIIFAVFGLTIGSFLNVVIYRLPKMMERQWAAECAEFSGKPLDSENETPFNLMIPRSRCPHCGHQIRWYENIPVLSYLFLLRGRCSSCKAPISFRYPAIEMICSALFFGCAWRWGYSIQALLWCIFCAVLLTLTMIDWDKTLLPDDLTLPLLWLGLVAAAMDWIPVGFKNAFWGAVAGYMSLWLIYWAFKLATGKEGMGYGDFKLYAALGAWFGWQALIPIILIAAIVGAVVGIAMKLNSSLREGGYVPFGPFLSGAGFITLYFGPSYLVSRFIL